MTSLLVCGCHPLRLLLLEAVAASAAIRFLVAGVAYVNFTKGAIIPCAVVFALRHATANARVYVLMKFVHLKPPIFPFFRDYKNSVNNF